MAFHVMGTGSRRMILQPNAKEIYDALEKEVLQLHKEFPNLILVTGMAEGWDEALGLIGLRNKIPYEAYVPNEGYANYYWRDHSLTGLNRINRFNQILEGACLVKYCCSSIRENGIHSNFIRNDYMIGRSDLALVYRAPGQASGGTEDAVRKMKGRIPWKTYPFN